MDALWAKRQAKKYVNTSITDARLFDYTELNPDGSVLVKENTRSTYRILNPEQSYPFSNKVIEITRSSVTNVNSNVGYVALTDTDIVDRAKSEGLTIGYWINKKDMEDAIADGTKSFLAYLRFFNGGTSLGYAYRKISPESLIVGSTGALISGVSGVTGQISVDYEVGDWAHITHTINITNVDVNIIRILPGFENCALGTVVKVSAAKIVFTDKYRPLIDYKNYYNNRKKTVYAFGDSITWLDGNTSVNYDSGNTRVIGYPAYLKQVGYEVVNYGVSGHCIAQYKESDNMAHGSIYDDVVVASLDVTGADIITILAGINDVGRDKNVLVEDVGLYEDDPVTYDTEEPFGALRGVLEYIFGSNPECKVYIIITPQTTYTATRSRARCLRLRQGLIEVAEMYGLPVIDLMSEVGFNRTNINNHTYDGVHPNNAGFKKIGESIVKGINSK